MAAVVVLGRASRARWLARRRKGLTATDVPAILGVSPWRTPLDVWLDKVNPAGWAGSYATRRGQRLEPFLAGEYARQYLTSPGECVERGPALLAHPDHPLLMCSIDYLAHHADQTVVLECKTAGSWNPDWADGDLPDQYAVQALVQAAVTGLPVVVWADVAGRPELRRIDRDPVWEAQAIPVLEAWWARHVVELTPPPLDPLRDYIHLNRVWRPEPGTTIEASDAVMGAVAACADLRVKNTHLDSVVTGLRTQIRAHMTTHTQLTAPGRPDLVVARVDRRGALTITYKPADLPEGIPA